MGRIANRLALKQHPMHPQASLLVRVAADYARGQDVDVHDELVGLLETGLRELQPMEFEELLSLARRLVEPRRDAEDVDDALIDATTQVREQIHGIGDGVGTLAAIPVMVTGDRLARVVGLCDMQCEALGDLLKEHDLVSEDASVEFLPRLLSPQEADDLLDGEVFRIARALSVGDSDSALDVLRSHSEIASRPETPPTRGSVRGSSFGVLVAFVRSVDIEMFPLASMMRHELNVVDAPHAAALSGNDEVFADVRGVLEGVARKLADILGVDAATFIEPADAWMGSYDSAAQHERSTFARMYLGIVADEHSNGHLDAVGLGLGSVGEDGSTSVAVHRVSDGAEVGVLTWPCLADEDVTDCLQALTTLMAGFGVFPLPRDEDETEAAMHRPLGSPLH